MSGGKAVALYSGGLDSTLAILAVMRQGIEVKAVTFLNHFGCEISDKSSCSRDPFAASVKFGFEVKLCHLSEKFIDIVKNPVFGHGKNMNPCIDCRILMLKEAREFMLMTDSSFIITGEVIGQRPMSQRRDTLNIIDREAGLRGLVLRPLSAKLLKPTIAEEHNIVDRSRLFNFSGRSRKPQMALAAEYGLTDYPSPAGGCLLTEPNYSYRLRELLAHDPDPHIHDLQLLRIGRHFRLTERCKVIVGRDRTENERILGLIDKKTVRLRVPGYGSPIAIVSGPSTESDLIAAASICARYSDARALNEVKVEMSAMDDEYTITVSPAEDRFIKDHMIEITKSCKTGLSA